MEANEGRPVAAVSREHYEMLAEYRKDAISVIRSVHRTNDIELALIFLVVCPLAVFLGKPWAVLLIGAGFWLRMMGGMLSIYLHERMVEKVDRELCGEGLATRDAGLNKVLELLNLLVNVCAGLALGALV